MDYGSIQHPLSTPLNVMTELNNIPVAIHTTRGPALLCGVEVVDERPGPRPLGHDQGLRLSPQEDEEALEHLVALRLQVEQPQLVLGGALGVPPIKRLIHKLQFVSLTLQLYAFLKMGQKINVLI